MSNPSTSSSTVKKRLDIDEFMYEGGLRSWLHSDRVDEYMITKLMEHPHAAYLPMLDDEEAEDIVKRIKALFVGAICNVVYIYRSEEHFRLLIVQKDEVYYYDSKRQDVPDRIRDVVDLLEPNRFIIEHFPVQKDLDNCGIFVILKALTLMEGPDKRTQVEADTQVKAFKDEALLFLHEHYSLFFEGRTFNPHQRQRPVKSYNETDLFKDAEDKARGRKRPVENSTENKEPMRKKSGNASSSSSSPSTSEEPSTAVKVYKKNKVSDNLETDLQAEIERKKQEIKSLNDLVTELRASVEEKDLEIGQLKTVQKERDNLATDLANRIKEAEDVKRAQQLEEERLEKYREELGAMERQQDGRWAEIVDGLVAVEKGNSDLARKKQELNDRERRVEGRERNLDNLERQISILTNELVNQNVYTRKNEEKTQAKLERAEKKLEEEKARHRRTRKNLIREQKDWNVMVEENGKVDDKNKAAFKKLRKQCEKERKEKERQEKIVEELQRKLQTLDLAKSRHGSEELPDFDASQDLQSHNANPVEEIQKVADDRFAENKALKKTLRHVLRKLKEAVDPAEPEDHDAIVLE